MSPQLPLITIIAFGSRGDVQPYVALGQGLTAAGYRVRIATGQTFQAFVEGHGLEFRPLRGDIKALLGSPAGLDLLEGKSGSGLIDEELLRGQLQDAWDAVQGSQMVLFAVLCTWGYHLAEALGVPGMMLSPMPVTETEDFPFLKFATPSRSPLSGWLNRLSYRLVALLAWRRYARTINTFRTEVLKLAPLPVLGAASRADAPPQLTPLATLYHHSATVIPRPGDWEDHIQQTGYWYLDQAQDYQPPPALARFLAAGPKPLYVGFGSMILRQPGPFADVLKAAIAASGQRVIMASGWGGLMEGLNSEQVFTLAEVPHDWLFPQTKAAIYHGGAGTVAACLRAGIPSVVVSFFADQPEWGKRLHQLGVAPQPLVARTLTCEALTLAIGEVVGNGALAQKAQALGQALGQEDGIANAIRHIEARLRS